MKTTSLTPKTKSNQHGKTMRMSPRSKKAESAPRIEQPALEATVDEATISHLDPRLIAPSPVNPRRVFDQDEMDELVASVRQHGVRQPISVRSMPAGAWLVEKSPLSTKPWTISHRDRPLMAAQLGTLLPAIAFDSQAEAEAALPRYEIIAGERRWRAARIAGRPTMRAIVEELDDIEAGELQTLENIQRVDLTDIEEATGYQYMLTLPGYNMARLVAGTGKSESTIRGKLKLLNLPEAVQVAVEKGKLPPATAELIGRLSGEMQVKAAKEILMPDPDRYYGRERGLPLSFRDAKQVIDRAKQEERDRQERDRVQAQLEAEGFTVLAESVTSSDGTPHHGCGYVAAKDACPRDSHGRTWKQVVNSGDAANFPQIVVTRFASLAKTYNPEGYKGVPVYQREQVNVLLKALDLWDSEGSEVAKEKEAKAAAKQQHANARDAMMLDIDAIADFAKGERSPAHALLAAVWAFTDDQVGRYGGADDFVAKRHAWITLEGQDGDGADVIRSRASDMTVAELQALVVELAVATMGREESYFLSSREEIRDLLEMEFSGGAGEQPQTSAVAELEEARI